MDNIVNDTYEENNEDRLKTVCFTGHRTIPSGDDLKALIGRVDGLVMAAYKKGYRVFIAGGAVGFDTLAACRVIVFRRRHPDVRLQLVLPCRNQTEKWENTDTLALYKRILGEADEVEYVTDFYTDTCMHERNRLMVDRSALCIAYLKSTRGGTAYTVNYAKKQGLGILNTCDNSFSIAEFDKFSVFGN